MFLQVKFCFELSLGVNRTALIDGLTDNVHNATESFISDLISEHMNIKNDKIQATSNRFHKFSTLFGTFVEREF
jgi:hypothetical protein